MRFLFKIWIFKYITIVLLTCLLFISNDLLPNSSQIIFHSDSAFVLYQNAQAEYHNGNYNAALLLFEQSGNMSKNIKAWKRYSHSLIGMTRCYRKLGEENHAIRYMEESINFMGYLSGSDYLLRLDILYTKALILIDRSEYEKSGDSLLKSLVICKENACNDSMIALINNALGIIYSKQGYLDTALVYYKKALDLKKGAMEQPDHELAIYNNNIAGIYMRTSNYKKANSYSLEALNILQQLASVHSSNLSSTYLRLGTIQYYLGNYDKSYSYYDSAELILILDLGEDHFKLYDIYEGKAAIYYNIGDMPKAEEYYQKALRIININDYFDKSKMSSMKYILGLIYFRQENLDQAMACFRECMTLNKKYNPYLLSNTYHAYAKCLEELGCFEDADKYYLFAIENRKEFYGEIHPSLAYDYLNYGIFLNTRNDTINGIRYLKKAEVIYQNTLGKKHPLTAVLHTRIGSFYQKQNKFNKALDYYQNAIIAATDNFENIDPFENPDFEDIIFETKALEALKGKGKALLERYNTQKTDTSFLYLSLATFNIATKVLHGIKTTSHLEESKNILSENEKDLYEMGIAVSLQLYEITNDITFYEKALNFASSSKAAILTSSIQEAEAKIVGQVPERYRILINEMKQTIGACQKHIFDELQLINPDSTKISRWRDELFENRIEYEKLIKEIENTYPEYFALKYAEPEILLTELRSKIENNEVLIEFVLTDNIIYSFLISKKQTRYYIASTDTLFERNLDDLLYLLYESHPVDQSQSDMERFVSASSNLYRVLISPFEDMIEDKDLRIVPDGLLTYVPFEILVSQVPEKRFYYYDLEYLIKNHSISYAYSTSLIKKQSKTSLKKPNIASFFPDYSTNTTDSVKGRDIIEPLYNLVFTDLEKDYLNSVPQSKIFSSENAVENIFVSEFNNWNILHLSMHGIVDPANPLYSKFIFTKSTDPNEDDLLHTYEIYNLCTETELSMLNVCNSGYGFYLSGEGIISLSRAFFYAGCKSIVTSLWFVNDECGATIIIDFYKHLLSGKSKTQSLQLAKIDYINNADPFHSHPHFWATYIVVGDPSKIVNGNRKVAIYFIIAAIWGIIVMYFTRKGMRYSKNRKN